MSDGSDPARPVVGKAIRTLAVRRLARGFLPLVALMFVAGIAGLTGVWTAPVTLGTLGGAPLAAGALLIVGQHAARVGFGIPPVGAWRWAGVVRVVPWAFALWILAVPALAVGREALAGGAWVPLGLSVLCGGLGLRALVDAVRVGELERLARTMSIATPEEGGVA